MPKNLFQKVWDAHTVRQLANGQTQLLIGTHLIHEVTSPQAFGMVRDLGLKVAFPHRTFATVDHIVPTDQFIEPYADPLAQAMMDELRKNCAQFGITFFDRATGKQGIVHIVGPEQGITQPGTTIACGDSHTSTHGAFGAIAFGIGTSQVRDVLATQTMALGELKVRRIEVNGKLRPGVYAKDVILHIIRMLGVNGGTGFAYEYAGSTFDGFSMEERMTVCNMSIEGGARVGYVNPDETTFAYLKGRPYAPKGAAFDTAVASWRLLNDDADAAYDLEIVVDCADIVPTITWGTSPGQTLRIDGAVPNPIDAKDANTRAAMDKALEYMGVAPGQKLEGLAIDAAFIGSCTNSRLSDLRAVAAVVKGRHVSPNLKKAVIVPGSTQVKRAAEREGLHEIFKAAGFEWRESGCSMCFNAGGESMGEKWRVVSSTNRNFENRQGPKTRTHLASPTTVAASALIGAIADVRKLG